ncbi:MAG: pantoate--beta-alanine ligase [Candidatus Omnitrophica bacterium]|nr:pantoate--beta-alanine ligase [Candidatus Omnitrophota bacterium]MDD5553010.1 pantoate--beta-alanine ligase [Candidatus Omnitrophota bacterium]
MKIIRGIKEMRELSRKAHEEKKRVGLVPTMGALHKGHLSLIQRARKENDAVFVSVFVNPIQFGPKEDYRRYPRNLKADARLCGQAGADAIFFPDERSMYSSGHGTHVCVEGLSDILCGKLRPGHFKGVTTVVAKLFNIVDPDTAYFGQKDAQQAVIVKKMAGELNMPVTIKVLPTVREKDGLAMSSRNAYLNDRERSDAAVLFQALTLAKDLLKRRFNDTSLIVRKMKELINSKRSVKIQYVCVVDPRSLRPLHKITGKALVMLAVKIGGVRLIDNIMVNRNA